VRKPGSGTRHFRFAPPSPTSGPSSQLPAPRFIDLIGQALLIDLIGQNILQSLKSSQTLKCCWTGLTVGSLSKRFLDFGEYSGGRDKILVIVFLRSKRISATRINISLVLQQSNFFNRSLHASTVGTLRICEAARGELTFYNLREADDGGQLASQAAYENHRG
jgi:hypothetical protein